MREDSEVELLLDLHAECGEGPIWDPGTSTLIWVDIPPGRVHRYDPLSGQDEVYEVGQSTGAAAIRDSGGLVLAVRDGFAALGARGGGFQMLAEVDIDDVRLEMNDGKCDTAGRFWAGTSVELDLHIRPGEAALYRLDPDHQAHQMLTGVTLSNGLGWSPDDRFFYYVDTTTQRLDVFDFDRDSGAISNRRLLAEIPAELGFPDGLTVDADGYIWLAVWGGWCVRRYAPDGTLDRVVKFPVSQISSCTFGGPDLTDLYVTSATQTLSPEARAAEPHAGALFRYSPGVKGLPPNSYRG